MRIAPSEVRLFLDSTTGERAALRYLAENPDLLFWSFFSVGGHMSYIVPEFGLGKDLRCDFVLLQSYSGGWKVFFVECEPVDDPVFNKDDTPSRCLRTAQKQICAWHRYTEEDGASLRSQMADACKKKDIWQRPRRRREPTSFSSAKLRDPKTVIHFKYAIVIGRRAALSEDKQHVKSSLSKFSDYDILSYDRFIDTAQRWEDYEADRKTREQKA